MTMPKPVLWILDRWAEKGDSTISAYDVLGCPVVGRDKEAGDWLVEAARGVQELISSQAAHADVTGEDQVIPAKGWLMAWAGRDFAASHIGMPILSMAKEKDGLARTLPWPSIDFFLSSEARSCMPAWLSLEAGTDHTPVQSAGYASVVRCGAQHVSVTNAAKRWLRFWSSRGFGFTAVEGVIPTGAVVH